MVAKTKKEKFSSVDKSTKTKPKSVEISNIFEFWKIQRFPALIIVVLSFVLYGSSIGYGYILDDKIVLSENNFVKNGFDGLSDIFGKESFTGYLGEQKDLVAGSRYRPLSIASFAIEFAFFKESPRISHFMNVLFYALTGLVLFRVLSLFFTYDQSRENQYRCDIAYP